MLEKIPRESKHKSIWHVSDFRPDKQLYLAFTYQQRAYCQLPLRQYALAIKDLDEAIKIRPDYALNFENRAKAQAILGNTKAAQTDLARFRDLESRSNETP